MIDSVQSRLRSLQAPDLVPLVRQALGKPTLTLLDWRSEPIAGGAGRYASGGLGVYRLSGTGRDPDGIHPWSLILKVTSGTAQTGSNDPGAWNYWKREVLVYQSGLLAQLPGSLSAPQCYAITEYPDEEVWLWLEDIREPAAPWPLERYTLAARHLGQFNGAYLTGYPLPTARPWLTWGRVHEWLALDQPVIERCRQYVGTSLARQWFLGDSFERMMRLWANRERLLHAFERLPICYCHHDAFRRNLLSRASGAHVAETVAIDWSIAGFGRIGEEVGISTANTLIFLEVASRHAKELDQAIFAGYVDGLRDAGWQGDVRLARLGYAVNAAMLLGVVWPAFYLEHLQTRAGVEQIEAMIGHPLDQILAEWAAIQSFLLDLGDEACSLA
jgi:Phosphotransferase enzyme family